MPSPRPRWIVAAVLSLLTLLTGAASAAAAVTGPDVSSWQHPGGASVDWSQVRASGQTFTYVKATEGATYTNPYYASDTAGAAAAGLYHGAYHYARPSAVAGSAAAQARAFAAAIGPQSLPGTLPPALDLEESGGLSPAQLSAWTQQFLDTLSGLTGRTPIIYTYPYFWQNAMANSTAFVRYPLWIASYGTGGPPTFGWPTWTFWQYSSTSSLPGVPTPGTLDMNRFNGSPEQLAALALTTAPVGLDPAPPTGISTPGASDPQVAPPPPARYVPVAPVRVADTRTGLGLPAGRVSGTTVTVTLPAGVPADAASALLNVSVVNPAGDGYLRAAAAGQAPVATALNFAGGHSVTGLVASQLNSARQVAITVYGGPTDVVVDLVGYYESAPGNGGHWVSLSPSRVADTRTGTGVPAGRSTGPVTFTLPSSVPADAAGVVLDVSVVAPGGDGYLNVTPAGAPAATTALNFSRGESLTGLAVTRSNAGQVTVTLHGGPADLVVDLVGYYDAGSASGASYVGAAPQRFLDTRTGLGAAGRVGGAVTVTLPATVPADASSVLVNLSVVNPSGPGYLRVAPAGTPATTTALNVTAGRSQTGLVLIPTGGARQLTVTLYGGPADLVADLVGYHTPG